ncbi:MAG: PhnD/SsuA/transferrin family substrate-binding protein [Cyanobium sp.]
MAFLLIEALDALRDGLRPFVIAVLQEKEGPRWFEHPRVQRMVATPPALQGEAPYGPEGPVLDLALLLKLIGSDCYWYRTFRPRLAGISHWQIDSLRELRNRVAHHDGEDPLLATAALALPYLNTMEQLLRVIGSDQASSITTLRQRLQRSRRRAITALILGRSPWSLLFWLVTMVLAGSSAWLVHYSQSPRIHRSRLIIGTPDRRLERYFPLEPYLEARLRPAGLWQALRGDRIDVRLEAARSYPEAIAHLREQRWDVVLGFSPVVSMEALAMGYRPVGRMFPQQPEYRAILFTRDDASLQSLDDITSTTHIALGDFFSATKYYVPMSLLRGRSARISADLSTAEIVDQVRSGRADVGAMAGNRQRFQALNPTLRILTSSPPLPASLVALSPQLGDLDRNHLHHALLAAPAAVRGEAAANFGPGQAPDYRPFARQVAEARAFSACLHHSQGVLKLHCPSSDRIEVVEGWIEAIRPDGNQIQLTLRTADHRPLQLLVAPTLLEQSAVFRVLQELRGRAIRVRLTSRSLAAQPVLLETPHQLEILP